MVLIERRLNASGSSSVASAVFALLGERNVRFVPPFKARSRFDGIESKPYNSSEVLSKLGFCLDVGVWGSSV